MPLNRICLLDDTALSIAPLARHCLESPLQKKVLHWINVIWHRNNYGLVVNFMIRCWFQYCSLSSYTSTVLVPVPGFRFLLFNTRVLGTRFSKDYCIFLIFLQVWLQFVTILVPDEIEPFALALEP